MDLRQALIRLFSKFAHLYDAGVPLAEALDLVRAELSPEAAEAVRGVVDDIYRGSSLADALERRGEIFGGEVVGLIRAGERRGDLGGAARSAAEGLAGRVLDPTPLPDLDLDALLEGAGDARAMHVEPDGRVRLRLGGRLVDGGTAPSGAVAALLERQGGAFLWRDRLLRVAVARTAEGPAAVIRLSGAPGDEPAEAAAWRQGPPALLLVLGSRDADLDAVLRSILRAFDPDATKRVAVDLPAPEALSVGTVREALALDPDVLCVGRLEGRDAELLVESGLHAVAGAYSERAAAGLPHRTLRV